MLGVPGLVWGHWTLPRSRQLGSRVLISVRHICNATEDTHFLVTSASLNSNTVPSQEPLYPVLLSTGLYARLVSRPGQRWAQPSFRRTWVWGRVVRKRAYSRDPCPSQTWSPGKKGIGWREKGTTGGWYPPACWGWAPQEDVLSWCPVPEPLHLPSSRLKKESVVGPLMSRWMAPRCLASEVTITDGGRYLPGPFSGAGTMP